MAYNPNIRLTANLGIVSAWDHLREWRSNLLLSVHSKHYPRQTAFWELAVHPLGLRSIQDLVGPDSRWGICIDSEQIVAIRKLFLPPAIPNADCSSTLLVLSFSIAS